MSSPPVTVGTVIKRVAWAAMGIPPQLKETGVFWKVSSEVYGSELLVFLRLKMASPGRLSKWFLRKVKNASRSISSF